MRDRAGTVRRVSAPPTATGVRHVSLRSGVYADSVRLMQVSRDVGAREGVTAVLVAMATPLNLELAAGMGLAPADGASPDQLLVFRPVAGWSSYALPVRGLWMCGAASHPGGGVHGMCGRNAAGAVLRAQRLRPWAR